MNPNESATSPGNVLRKDIRALEQDLGRAYNNGNPERATVIREMLTKRRDLLEVTSRRVAAKQP